MSAKILVVDDIAPNVKLLEAKLTREFFRVVTAMSGPEALEKARTERPDVILLDIMMPGMDGFEVCERLKADPLTQNIPVVMVTALTDISDRVRGLEAGADDFLSKPVNDLALMSRVRSLIRLKMTADEWMLREETAIQFGAINHVVDIKDVDTAAADILLVESNAMEAQRLVESLQRDRHKVTVVSNGVRAMEMAEQIHFDVILVNLNLDGEDGLRLCSHLRLDGITKSVPIIMLAEDQDMVRVATGLEFNGAHDYLLRPIDRNELRARVKTQVRRRRFQKKLRSNYEASISLALTDSLTGLFNRRYLMAHLKKMMDDASVGMKPLCVLMFDIDHFKNVNDTYGHGVGDEVLREFAGRLSKQIRSFDMLARLGGEEFIAVLPNIGRHTAFDVAYRLRKVISDMPFNIAGKGQIAVTCSIGGVILEDTMKDVETAIDRADKALYEAKDSGRNCVYFEGLGLISQANVINPSMEDAFI
ncbi:MAG: diguanylate cyclase domain protein [Alphaproteobacteria bacterium]|nr:diguanylate cyclase domain protein [Alphaproteobacteria bacterium]